MDFVWGLVRTAGPAGLGHAPAMDIPNASVAVCLGANVIHHALAMRLHDKN